MACSSNSLFVLDMHLWPDVKLRVSCTVFHLWSQAVCTCNLRRRCASLCARRLTSDMWKEHMDCPHLKLVVRANYWSLLQVITVKAKYVVDNQTGMPIEIKQKGSPDMPPDFISEDNQCARRLAMNERQVSGTSTSNGAVVLQEVESCSSTALVKPWSSLDQVLISQLVPHVRDGSYVVQLSFQWPSKHSA